ncbi:MAG: hypothetical protein FWF80_07810 [Defluviitaleaceae bacterium]|nr:hypothetical protein [Defluviitaleaceae bacterium]
MRKLRLRKNLLTVCTFVYAAVLAASVTYAAVTGVITFTGTANTSADLQVVIDDLTITTPPSPFGSQITNVVVTDGPDGQIMTFDVDLRAPGDFASMMFNFVNMGALPVEFEAMEVEISPVYSLDESGQRIPVLDADLNQIMVEGVPVYAMEDPIEIEGYTYSGARDIDDIDGYELDGGLMTESSRFGLAFVWEESSRHVTDAVVGAEPITVTIRFPFVIGSVDRPLHPAPVVCNGDPLTCPLMPTCPTCTATP